ncbi:Imm52 family immunity protein [Burkholderia ubonensis]|uniref:Imm52 family immunity protein n=1 Tax=Burkholderia ubonensis TaxID=101571 RepID=UPI0009B4AAA1|nr:Imm52 family immunity protein [Burkholderia ubonensis]
MVQAENCSSDLELRLVIRQEPTRIPSAEQRCEELWRFAKLLESVGLNMSQWLVNGDSATLAFDSTSPTPALIRSASDDPESPIQFADVWNGIEGKGAAGLVSKYRMKRRSGFDFRAVDVNGLKFYRSVADLVEGALGIWPSLLVEVAPYAYSDEKVFFDRPGVGWMLYLPKRIETEQVPEARMMRHVRDVNGTEGTIVVSVIDGPFDVANSEHVKVANAIEIRLADQDLLPRYADL